MTVGKLWFLFACTLLSVVVASTSVKADACSAAISVERKHIDQFQAQILSISSRSKIAKTTEDLDVIECDMAKAFLEFAKTGLTYKLKVERVCGSQVKTKCSSNCIRSDIAKAQMDVVSKCN